MSLILSGEGDHSCSSFMQICVESLMTIWFVRFGIPMNQFEMTMLQILEQTKDVANGEVAQTEAPMFDPVSLGMELADDTKVAEEAGLFDGSPVTVEKLVAVGTKFIEDGLVVSHIAKMVEEIIADD
ncbi:MAG: hypothetical protein PHU86_03145 [Patescibacteria group bacterium]|nr:hypothetical protein [Patescibacteria group bacterium]